MSPSDLSQREQVLLTCLILEEQGTVSFRKEDLVVQCWMQFPNSFGLNNYIESHPDSHKVLSYLMGERGWLRSGYLDNSKENFHYRLTSSGRALAYEIAEKSGHPIGKFFSPKLDTPSKVWEDFHKRIIRTDAYDLFHTGLDKDITITHALDFWECPRESRTPVKYRNDFLARLHFLDQYLRNQGLVLPSGQLLTITDSDKILNVDIFLSQRFQHVLKVLKIKENGST